MYFRHYPTAETNKNHYCNCFYVFILDFYYDKFEASTLPVYTMSSYIDSLLNSECNQEFADPTDQIFLRPSLSYKKQC
jgi:hypothetical protein